MIFLRSEEIKNHFGLCQHPEGGWFSEEYTSTEGIGGRPLAGSIYFLLDEGEISHFHQIDCDEIWYFHEGCGMKITVLADGEKKEYLLGNDFGHGQTAMVVIPKDAIFAAENLADDFTFVSCATAPHFHYDGFRLVYKSEIADNYPEYAAETDYLAYPDL